MQSGLYRPGRGRRSPCPQEIHKFLAADACFNFQAQRKPAIWLSEDLPPAGATFFLRVCLKLQARPVKCASAIKHGSQMMVLFAGLLV